MNRYELQYRINNTNEEISYLQNQNARLQEDRERFVQDYGMIQKEKDKEEMLFASQKRKKENITGIVRGRAATSFVEKIGQGYSTKKLAELFQYYDGILSNIRKNIEIADERIQENNRRILQLQGNISSWNKEIQKIIKEEQASENHRK